jgi:hypothetical protein
MKLDDSDEDSEVYSHNGSSHSKQQQLLKQSKHIKKKFSGIGFSKSPKLVAMLPSGNDFPDYYMMSNSQNSNMQA